jgi:uncharacterized membrane protein
MSETADAPSTLERAVGIVLRCGVTASSACLAVGLVLSFIAATGAISALLLQIGVIVLLATPVARVVVSIVEYTIQRDWTFATLTLIVLVELLASAAAALVFNRRV